MTNPQHPPLSPTQNAAACAILGIVIALAMGTGYKLASHDSAAATDGALQATRQALRAATHREDSLKVASTARLHRDSLAWLGYVQQVRASGHDSLQAALTRASRRAGAEVFAALPGSLRLDRPMAPHPGDVPEERPSTCSVELSCSQAADLLADDSLLRRRQDSLTTTATVASAACTTAVLTQRQRGDSLAALPPRKASWSDRAMDAAFGAGLMATVFAILGIVW